MSRETLYRQANALFRTHPEDERVAAFVDNLLDHARSIMLDVIHETEKMRTEAYKEIIAEKGVENAGS